MPSFTRKQSRLTFRNDREHMEMRYLQIVTSWRIEAASDCCRSARNAACLTITSTRKRVNTFRRSQNRSGYAIGYFGAGRDAMHAERSFATWLNGRSIGSCTTCWTRRRVLKMKSKHGKPPHEHVWYWVRQYGIEPIDWVWECSCGALLYGWDVYK